MRTRPPWILPRSRRAPDPQRRFAEPHPAAVLGRRAGRGLRRSATVVAQRGTLSIVGLLLVGASVAVAFGFAAGLAAIGAALVLIDWRIL